MNALDVGTACTTRVAILAFPETSASVIYGMYDLLTSAGRDWGLITEGMPGTPLLDAFLVARTCESIETPNGVPIRPRASIADMQVPDLICVPEVALPPSAPLREKFDREIAWLRDCYRAGATVATACSGAMLLAEAGLLDGHEATTHWAYCPTLQTRFPRVKVHAHRALVISGEGHRLIMAGGGTSWLDLSLYVIARLAGIEAAMQVARLNLIDWHEIGQQPFARLAPSIQVDDAAITRAQLWVAENYHQPAPVAAMVRVSELAERSFKRRFALATGMSPIQYVHTVRMEEAKHMLETTDAPVDSIAADVGYEDARFFSRLFRRNVNLTPAQYRRRFQGMRQALQTNGLVTSAGQRRSVQPGDQYANVTLVAG